MISIKTSRLYSKVEYNKPSLFFSTMDYYNTLFTSNNPKDILKFYSLFEDSESLINWMKERPWGYHNIIEVQGNKEIIVVIPTADYNGEYAKRCREVIFKGLHIIFVESGNYHDPYFNYAKNANFGVKKAIEYNPKWIIISNDDMYKIDDVDILKKQLASIDSNSIGVVYAYPTNYHSYKVYLSRFTFLSKLFFFIRNKYIKSRLKLHYLYDKKYGISLQVHGSSTITKLLYKKNFVLMN
ncbi:MAG: hypothetical protein ACP5RS_05330, partial [Thermoplasmata archaeon]